MAIQSEKTSEKSSSSIRTSIDYPQKLRVLCSNVTVHGTDVSRVLFKMFCQLVRPKARIS